MFIGRTFFFVKGQNCLFFLKKRILLNVSQGIVVVIGMVCEFGSQIRGLAHGTWLSFQQPANTICVTIRLLEKIGFLKIRIGLSYRTVSNIDLMQYLTQLGIFQPSGSRKWYQYAQFCITWINSSRIYILRYISINRMNPTITPQNFYFQEK